jgi:acetyl/propionyl-CoA carboxylase alpha subunit
MIRRVLIANRGEIARRVVRTCRRLGIETVAVYSDADRGAPHVAEADASVAIGPAPAIESYLNIDRVVDAARTSGADAVHPGYGFLSERADFAEACTRAGLAFVGPPADVMRALGSKTGARAIMERAGVPVVPGAVPPSQSDADIAAAVATVGFPALLKAAAGGGGKGMRVVRRPDEVWPAIQSARQEAGRAFGRDALYVERLVERARHIEVQIFGDHDGRLVHLFERDCTLQRRHQKVIEETPGPSVTDGLRARLTTAALAAARAAGYVNAGTVEFLVEGEGDDARFYFLEINMRLQVEHPITEAVTGLDLVAAQLAVAAGQPLPFRQDDIASHGHAIECRVYAEDARRLLPQTGRLVRYREPAGAGIRVDGGVIEGEAVTVYYDPLLAKVIAHGATRGEAHTRVSGALRDFDLLGVRQNIAFLLALLARPEVGEGRVHTRFIDAHLDELASAPSADQRAAALAVAARVSSGPVTAIDDEGENTPSRDPWDTLGSVDW